MQNMIWILLAATLVACGSDDKPVIGNNTANNTADLGMDSTTQPDVGGTTDAGLDQGADVGMDQGASEVCATPQDCLYTIANETVVDVDGLTTQETVTGRELPLVANIPMVADPVPVVVFSHGGSLNNDGQNLNKQWGALLARNGFAVIHVGHAEATGGQGMSICTAASVPMAECTPSEDDNGLLAIVRAYDIAAVLEDLPRLSQISQNNDGPELDLSRVVVAGWSAGSRGPSVLMGAKIRPTTSAPLFGLSNALPKAAVMLSPAGPGFGGYFDDGVENSWDEMRGPLFFATGTNDVKPNKPELTGAIRRQAFDLQPSDGHRYLLYSNLEVGVGGHGTYDLSDLNSPDPLPGLTMAISSAVLAFLDAEINDNAAGREWLASDKALQLAGDAQWSKK